MSKAINNQMKKILITGASGFIGSFLVEEAIERGYEVYAGIRKSSSKEYLQNPKINFIELDFSSKENIKKQLQSFDYIIHAAGLTKSCREEDFERVNYQYTVNFIEALQENNIVPEKFIFISSLAVYGPGNPKKPVSIKVDDEKKPITLYGHSKLKIEKYIQSLVDFPYLIFRPTGVYGPREKDFYVMYKTVKSGIETYIDTKQQYLTFVYVKDLVKVFFDALASDIKEKTYFVTDLNNYTAQDLNDYVKQALQVKTITIIFPRLLVKGLAYLSEKFSCLFTGKVATLNTEKYKEIIQKNWLCESTELVNDFDYQPQYDLEKGINETIQWYKKNKLL